MKKNKIQGFTLIELLIVVAIIAILAAIAIPNFLAAQVRAKASRARAGMRTVATAVEAYYVDNNTYPPAHTAFSAPFSANNYMVPYEVTTPVAYITSLPSDPFDRFDTANPNALRTLRYRRPGWGLDHNASGVPTPTNVSLYVPDGFPTDLDAYPGTIANHFYGTSSPAENCPIYWAMWSVGPDGDFESEAGVQPCRLVGWYDPTNGTVSNGNICRFSSGIVTP